MSMFRWTAPLFKLASKRFSEDDFAFVADKLRSSVPPGGVFADLGGGTGELSAGVARQLDARVVIVDITSQMLRRVSPDPLVSVRLARAEALPFSDAYFDGLLCVDAFHHIRDQDAAAREMARVVRPGGAVLVFEYTGAAGSRLAVVIERLLREPATFLAPEEFRRLMKAHGIEGATTLIHRGVGSYFFLGTVGRHREPIVRAPPPATPA